MVNTYSEYTEELAEAVDKVCSPAYAQMFVQVAKEQPQSFSAEQGIMLTGYPNTITWYQGDRRPEIIERIRRTHLKWFNQWLSVNNTGQPPYVEWGKIMNHAVLHLSNLFFRIDLGDVITTDDTRYAFQQIADTLKRILLTITKSNPESIDPAAICSVQTFLLILFYFTLDSDLVIYLKGLQLVDLMNVLIRTSNNDNEIHLQAYRILAVVMAEDDLIKLQNSSRIATVFITIIQNVIEVDARTEARLFNSLRSLKGESSCLFSLGDTGKKRKFILFTYT
jgi:hypothetical protein